MKASFRTILLSLAVIALFGALGYFFDPFEGRKPDPYSKLIGRQIPEFSLVAHTGQSIRREDLSGKVWVASLMFATCRDVCLQIAEHLKKIDRSIQSIPEARIVSISINPEEDRPEALTAYAKGLDASGQWLFLTGERSEIRKLAQAGLFLSAGTDEAPLFHSEKLVVIDAQGAVRGYFDGLDPASVSKITKLLNRLQKQSGSSPLPKTIP